MTIRAFPFDALPTFSREELRLRAGFRALSRNGITAESLGSALSELVDDSVAIAVKRIGSFESATVSSEAVGVLLAPAEDDASAMLIDVEPALAGALVARALRHRAPRVVDPARGPSPEVAGAFAAVLLAVARRVQGSPIRVLSAGPVSGLVRAIPSRLATIWLAVTIGRDVFSARLSIPTTLLPAETASSSRTFAALRDTPLALPLVAGSCIADRALLASLRAGDVFVVPQFPLTAQGTALGGPVALVPPRSERGLRAHLGHDGRLMLGSHLGAERVGDFPWDTPPKAGEPMSDDPNPTLAVLEDAPVVVRVELGVVEMRAREWGALAPGDVVTLGRNVGDPAILRVGGVEVARGELVVVDGEYGVRVLPRAGEKA